MGGQESAEPIGGESGGISAPPAAHTAGGAVGAEGGGGEAASVPGCQETGLCTRYQETEREGEEK